MPPLLTNSNASCTSDNALPQAANFADEVILRHLEGPPYRLQPPTASVRADSVAAEGGFEFVVPL
jgi:hypothetical protein